MEAWAGRRASERILRYYQYLFTFPSIGFMLLVVLLSPTLSLSMAFSLIHGLGILPHVLSLSLLGVVAPLLASDLLGMLLLMGEPFLTPRRFTIISYSSSLFYPLLIFISPIALLSGRLELPVRVLLLLVAFSSSLRCLVLLSLSISPLRGVPSILLQPIASFLLLCLILQLNPIVVTYSILATAILMISALLLILIVGGRDRRTLPLLRAFALAWAEGVREPLEEEMDRLGESSTLHIDALYFLEDDQPKAALITPYIHPGPFREVGSSILPRMISEALEHRYGCLPLVSHGISTHDRDLTRREEAERAVETLISTPPPAEHTALTTRPMRVVRGKASALCQLFGDAALVILTVSPKSFDDLPDELRTHIEEEASKRGLRAILIDAHNSLEGVDKLTDEDLEDLHRAAVEAMERALVAPRRPFTFGVYRVIPKEWGLEEGMGPCGISTLTLHLEGDGTYAYIVLDGNNLKAGLRERILEAVRELGLDEGEVMTTDTHLVNAIGVTPRGYYTIGERMEEELLIKYVVEACREALSGMAPGEAAHSRITLPEMRVLGVKGLEAFADILESSFSLFKKTMLILLPSSLLLASLPLLLI